MSDAYEHNGDRVLLESLGLRTTGFGRDFTDLGTVVLEEAKEQTYGNPEETKVCPATTIKVEVGALPAQFWRFTITRPRDEVEELPGKDERGRDRWRSVCEPAEVFVMTTGSGGFGTYWPMAKLIARHMADVERVDVE